MVKGILLGVISLFSGSLFITLAAATVKYIHADDFAGASLALIAGIVVFGALYLVTERGERQ